MLRGRKRAVDRQLILTDILAGDKYAAIAAKYGVTGQYVSAIARDAGVRRQEPRSPNSHQMISAFLSLRDYCTADMIAKLHGVTRNTVIGVWNRHGGVA